MAAAERQVAGPDAMGTLLAFSDLETQIARFYERLAEMFEDNPGVGEFWLQLAEEEFEHAEALRYAAETLPLMLAGVSGRRPLIEGDIINRINREINLCEALMTLHEGSLDAAFRCALFLESAELNQIYPWLLNQVPLVWTETLRAMNEDPDGHIVRLCQAIERYSQDRLLRKQAKGLRNQWEDYAMK
jgi:hypothetical protein